MPCISARVEVRVCYPRSTQRRENGKKETAKTAADILLCLPAMSSPALTQCNSFLLRVDHAPQDLKGSTLHGDSSGTSPTEPHPSQPSKRPLFHVGPAGTDWKPSFVRFSLSYPKGLSKTRTDVTHASHPTHPVDGLAGARFCLDAKPSPTIRHPHVGASGRVSGPRKDGIGTSLFLSPPTLWFLFFLLACLHSLAIIPLAQRASLHKPMAAVC